MNSLPALCEYSVSPMLLTTSTPQWPLLNSGAFTTESMERRSDFTPTRGTTPDGLGADDETKTPQPAAKISGENLERRMGGGSIRQNHSAAAMSSARFRSRGLLTFMKIVSASLNRATSGVEMMSTP